MGTLSPKQIHEVNAGLLADVRLPPPAELANVPEQHGGDDLLKRVLEKIAVLEKENKSLRQQLDAASQKGSKSLRQKLDASQKENKARGLKLTAARKEKKSLLLKLDASQKKNESLGQKLSASQNENKERGQKLGAVQDEKKSLGQELSAYQTELDMRQVLKEFLRQKGKGKKLDTDLMKKVCKIFPSYFKDTLFNYHGNAIYTFSETVIYLATEKKNLLKETKDLNLSSNRCSKIESIDIKLAKLKAVANSFEKPDMKWDGSLGEGFYSWCLLVADVNKACHRDINKELLDDMDRRAARGEYSYGEVKLGPAVQAVIRQMRLQL